jgi:membrane protein required for colicin V production
MPIIDIIIAVAITISIIVGVMRGFVKEAMSLAALLIAIWAALFFGAAVGGVAESWLGSEELQAWFGRILVFAIVLSLGGLLSWSLSKIISLSVLKGVDRLAGSAFGAVRGVLLVAICVLAGGFIGFSNDGWWEWIKKAAPEGVDLLTPDSEAESLPIDLPG